MSKRKSSPKPADPGQHDHTEWFCARCDWGGDTARELRAHLISSHGLTNEDVDQIRGRAVHHLDAAAYSENAYEYQFEGQLIAAKRERRGRRGEDALLWRE